MVRLSAEIDVNGTVYEISNNLIKISFSGQDRSDTSLPSWGIKSNSGSLEMYDTDGTFEKLSQEGSLANAEIRIYLNIVGTRKVQIGGFYVIGASQNKQTHKTTIEFEDILMSWQQKKQPKYYNFVASEPVTIATIIDAILETHQDIQLNVFDDKTDLRIQNLYIAYREMQEGTVWAQMTKICEASSCYIYCNEEGIPTIYYGGET
jgi:hypothetical protein